MLLVTDEDDDRPVRSERSVVEVRVYLVLCTAGLGSCFLTALVLAADSDLLLTAFVAIASDLLLEVSLEDLAFLSTPADCKVEVVVVVEVVR